MSGTMRTGTTLWTARPTAAAASFRPITCCLLEQQTSGTRRPSGALSWDTAGGRRVWSCPNLAPLFHARMRALSLSDPEAEVEPVKFIWPGACPRPLELPEPPSLTLAERGTSGSPGLAEADCGFLGNSALWRSRASTQSETGRRGPLPHLLLQSLSGTHNLQTLFLRRLTSFPSLYLYLRTLHKSRLFQGRLFQSPAIYLPPFLL